jgi:hypothetical protein
MWRYKKIINVIINICVKILHICLMENLYFECLHIDRKQIFDEIWNFNNEIMLSITKCFNDADRIGTWEKLSTFKCEELLKKYDNLYSPEYCFHSMWLLFHA